VQPGAGRLEVLSGWENPSVLGNTLPKNDEALATDGVSYLAARAGGKWLT